MCVCVCVCGLRTYHCYKGQDFGFVVMFWTVTYSLFWLQNFNVTQHGNILYYLDIYLAISDSRG